LKQGLVHREYALRENAPPHYRYKTVNKEDFENKMFLAVEEFTNKVTKALGGLHFD
jgi:predicted transcriptional regulator